MLKTCYHTTLHVRVVLPHLRTKASIAFKKNENTSCSSARNLLKNKIMKWGYKKSEQPVGFEPLISLSEVRDSTS